MPPPRCKSGRSPASLRRSRRRRPRTSLRIGPWARVGQSREAGDGRCVSEQWRGTRAATVAAPARSRRAARCHGSMTARREAQLTRGRAQYRWCEAHLHLPEGRFVGQPLRMAEFMRTISARSMTIPTAPVGRSFPAAGRTPRRPSARVSCSCICAGPSIASIARCSRARSRAIRRRCCSPWRRRSFVCRRSSKA